MPLKLEVIVYLLLSPSWHVFWSSSSGWGKAISMTFALYMWSASLGSKIASGSEIGSSTPESRPNMWNTEPEESPIASFVFTHQTLIREYTFSWSMAFCGGEVKMSVFNFNLENITVLFVQAYWHIRKTVVDAVTNPWIFFSYRNPAHPNVFAHYPALCAASSVLPHLLTGDVCLQGIHPDMEYRTGFFVKSE